MRQEKTQLQILPKRYCNKIRNGYEFISNDRNVMYVLTRCVSMLGEQENIYYYMKVYVKEATEWLKTSGSRCFNDISEFENMFANVNDFYKAFDDYNNLKQQ